MIYEHHREYLVFACYEQAFKVLIWCTNCLQHFTKRVKNDWQVSVSEVEFKANFGPARVRLCDLFRVLDCPKHMYPTVLLTTVNPA
jgi:hypothetical protein